MLATIFSGEKPAQPANLSLNATFLSHVTTMPLFPLLSLVSLSDKRTGVAVDQGAPAVRPLHAPAGEIQEVPKNLGGAPHDVGRCHWPQ